jgi:hypothetical protein
MTDGLDFYSLPPSILKRDKDSVFGIDSHWLSSLILKRKQVKKQTYKASRAAFTGSMLVDKAIAYVENCDSKTTYADKLNRYIVMLSNVFCNNEQLLQDFIDCFNRKELLFRGVHDVQDSQIGAVVFVSITCPNLPSFTFIKLRV